MAENNDVYVRQDVFDARMDRLEILIEKNGIELKAYIDNSINEVKNEIQQVRSDLTGEIQHLNAEVKVLEGRVDNVVDVVYWGVGGFGVILAAAVFVPMIMGFLKRLFTPSVTIEDVRRVMNEDIEQIVNVAVSRQLARLTVEEGE